MFCMQQLYLGSIWFYTFLQLLDIDTDADPPSLLEQVLNFTISLLKSVLPEAKASTIEGKLCIFKDRRKFQCERGWQPPRHQLDSDRVGPSFFLAKRLSWPLDKRKRSIWLYPMENKEQNGYFPKKVVIKLNKKSTSIKWHTVGPILGPPETKSVKTPFDNVRNFEDFSKRRILRPKKIVPYYILSYYESTSKDFDKMTKTYSYVIERSPVSRIRFAKMPIDDRNHQTYFTHSVMHLL